MGKGTFKKERNGEHGNGKKKEGQKSEYGVSPGGV